MDFRWWWHVSGGCAWAETVPRTSLYLPFNSAVNLKLLQKLVHYIFKKQVLSNKCDVIPFMLKHTHTVVGMCASIAIAVLICIYQTCNSVTLGVEVGGGVRHSLLHSVYFSIWQRVPTTYANKAKRSSLLGHMCLGPPFKETWEGNVAWQFKNTKL